MVSKYGVLTLDKFGESILNCPHCRTYGDFVHFAIYNSLTFYVGTFSFILVTSVLGRIDFGRYWRYVTLFGLLVLEGLMIFSNGDVYGMLLPWRTVYEKLQFLQQGYILLFLCVSQIGPLLFPPPKSLRQVISEVESLTRLEMKESLRNFSEVFEPFEDDMKLLRQKMEKITVELQILESDETMRQSYGRIKKRVRNVDD
jgi:hypothetical protein